MAAAPITIEDARFAAFCLMEMSGLPVCQMWAAMAPYLSRRQAQRRPTWSAVHERLTDLLLCSVEAPEVQDTRTVLLIFQGGLACRSLSV